MNKLGFVIAATMAASVPSVNTTPPTHGSDTSQNNDNKCKNGKQPTLQRMNNLSLARI
jgi:hypothetical protein